MSLFDTMAAAAFTTALALFGEPLTAPGPVALRGIVTLTPALTTPEYGYERTSIPGTLELLATTFTPVREQRFVRASGQTLTILDATLNHGVWLCSVNGSVLTQVGAA